MYQAPVYQPPPYSNSHVPRYSEYDNPLTQSYDRVSRFENRDLPSTYQAPPSPSARIFYDLSAHESEDDAPSRSPYSVRSFPVASTYRFSSPTRRSPAIKERDVGTDINIASLVLAGIVGATSISLQAKGNSIAAASYRLALASRDATVRSAQSVGLGVAAAGGRVGGAMGGSAITPANAVGGVASGIMHTGSNGVASYVTAVGSAASGITQAGISTVNGVSIVGGVSRWLPRFPSFQFRLPNLNPFGGSAATTPLGGQEEGNSGPTFADRDIRRLQDGTLELFRNLEDGTAERITIIDERLFPTISGLAHEDIVLIASGIADTMFDIGSDTDTYTNTDASSEVDEQEHGDNLLMAIEPIPMQYNPWAVDSGLLTVE